MNHLCSEKLKLDQFYKKGISKRKTSKTSKIMIYYYFNFYLSILFNIRWQISQTEYFIADWLIRFERNRTFQFNLVTQIMVSMVDVMYICLSHSFFSFYFFEDYFQSNFVQISYINSFHFLNFSYYPFGIFQCCHVKRLKHHLNSKIKYYTKSISNTHIDSRKNRYHLTLLEILI